MKSNGTRKIVVIFSILIVTVLSAILVAFATGNTRYPSLSDPNGVFYERYDESGNVVYNITNKELFEEIKGNDGIQQTLLMVDSYLLKSYLDNLTDQQIQDKITKLTYGTTDPEQLAEIDADTLTKMEETYASSMVLAGYSGNEEEYASIVLARELYARYIIDFNKNVTALDVAKEYVSNYFEDIKAIRIRFTSSADAKYVMQNVNLLVYNTLTLREYLGFVFTDETMKDENLVLVEAKTTVDPFYFDASENIKDLKDAIVYTKGTNNIYTKAGSTNEYSIDESGNLVDVSLTVIIANELLFSAKTDAVAYKTANTEYFSVSKVDAFDEDEEAEVIDHSDNLVYTIDSDGKIYDLAHTDVTSTTDLIVNKVYTTIDHVTVGTLNNSRLLTDQEILLKYIQMYNYVYGDYRTLLPETATVQSLKELNNPDLSFNYKEVSAMQSSLATYMFKTLNSSTNPYTISPKAYAGQKDNSYYMVYKLHQEPKVDLYGKMADLILAQIKLPAETVTNLSLPTTGWYNSTISWSSSPTGVIASNGTVTLPETDKIVTLTLTISINGVATIRSTTVKVLASGTTSTVIPSTDIQVPITTVLNDPTIYSRLYKQLVDDKVYGANGDKNISAQLIALRQQFNLSINDYYLSLEYAKIDAEYVFDDKGHKNVLVSVSGKLGDAETALEITADDFMDYVMTKNPGLYILYAAQAKEQIYSTYFTEVFGEQTKISKNRSEKMNAMFAQIQSAKDYYVYLGNLYGQYGMALPYNSFSDYAYLQYGTKTEAELLVYFIQGVMQPYMINEAIDAYDLVDLLYPTVQDYYENYFSLGVTHIVIFIDFDENGVPDNYDEYVASLDETQLSQFETYIAQLETAVDEYEGTFAQIITAYQNATRSDEIWGTFKQAGIFMMTETLDQKDSDGVSHSVTYSGEYGVKDSYVKEYVDKLVSLYQEYRLEQNLSLENMIGTVTTEFGYHIIKVTKGTAFTRPSASFTEANPSSPIYTTGSVNPNGEPTLEQVALYAQYFFYSTAYDLSDADIESQYDITIPNLPASVSSALKVYFESLLESMYVLGTVNVVLADHLVDGEFLECSYTDLTSSQIMAMLNDVHDVYYQALYGDYSTE